MTSEVLRKIPVLKKPLKLKITHQNDKGGQFLLSKRVKRQLQRKEIKSVYTS